MISDSPTSYLCLCTGVRTNDDGAVECRGLAVRQQATRQQLKAMLLHERTAVIRAVAWRGSTSAPRRTWPETELSRCRLRLATGVGRVKDGRSCVPDWPGRSSRKEPLMSQGSMVLLDAAGRRRSPATRPGYLAGRAPRNKGMQYPPDPPCPEEIIVVMRNAGHDRHGLRIRALIAILWRGGLRISEALALDETDIDERRGSLLMRRGLCRIRDKPRYAECLAMPSRACTDRVVPAQIKIDDHRTRHNHSPPGASSPVEWLAAPVEGCVVHEARRWAAWARKARWEAVAIPGLARGVFRECGPVGRVGSVWRD